ncbi:MAG: hypothetical protein F4Y37_15650 [Caldilineaceae bacterium SB0664_bin_22]|nr:hypothetical protein [Caldilineaceae bacterium SB0664_bin_22]
MACRRIHKIRTFIGPLLYQSRDPTKYTVGWGLAMAGSTLMILPVILVFYMAQRFFIQGIAVSGIKV